MHKFVAVAGALVFGLSIPAYTEIGGRQESRSAAASKAASSGFDNYQIPAGAALLLKLRTPLDSTTTSVDEQVDAVLWSPIIQDGVELIPVGSVAMGKVLSVVRASDRTPIGSVTFVFTIIEHAGTKDRAMLHSQKLVVEGPRQPRSERGRGKDKLKVAQASMPAGTPLVAMTAEPLIVRIPR